MRFCAVEHKRSLVTNDTIIIIIILYRAIRPLELPKAMRCTPDIVIAILIWRRRRHEEIRPSTVSVRDINCKHCEEQSSPLRFPKETMLDESRSVRTGELIRIMAIDVHLLEPSIIREGLA